MTTPIEDEPLHQSSTLSCKELAPVMHDISSDTLAALETSFRGFLDDDEAVITDERECSRRSSTIWVPSPKANQRPAIVLKPSSTEQVSRIMRICAEYRVPVTSYSGGTSLTGALIATRHGGVCIDFGRMNRILTLNRTDLDIAVQPGVGWSQLNDHLRHEGLFFPPDPYPEACVGGMIATSCAGTNAYRYGTMKEWVVSLTVVLADGTVIRTRRRPRKSSAGYDLTHLIIGSEGTLGLVTEAILRVTALPQNVHVAIASFPDYRAAVQAGVTLANGAYPIDALEFLCDRSLRMINESRLSSRTWAEKPTLFLKFSGSKNTVNDLISLSRETALAHGSLEFESTGDSEEIESLWSARKFDGKATILQKKDPSDFAIPSDAAVPISRIADLMAFSFAKLDESHLNGAISAHLGDGNLHVKIVGAKGRKTVAEEVIRSVEFKAIDMDGTTSGEHGIGLKLREQLVYELGQPAVDMMRKVKAALDPLFLLNCDKVFELEVSQGKSLNYIIVSRTNPWQDILCWIVAGLEVCIAYMWYPHLYRSLAKNRPPFKHST